MEHWKDRTYLLMGQERVEALAQKHVLVMGLGGVGAYAAEQLARAGIGQFTLVDGDTVHPSNINRQLLALHSSCGKSKVALMQQRIADINPMAKVNAIHQFMKDDDMIALLQQPYSYVVDAIDSLAPKIFLIYHSLQAGLPLVSAMGAGGKTNPSLVQIADIADSYNDNLARILRKRLHRLGVYSGFKVVFSPEKIDPSAIMMVEGEENKKTTVGTISYMPAIFGNFMSSIVLQHFLQSK